MTTKTRKQQWWADWSRKRRIEALQSRPAPIAHPRGEPIAGIIPIPTKDWR